MAAIKVFTEQEFEKFTRHYTAPKRDAFRRRLLDEGRLLIERTGKSSERKAMEDEDAIFSEVEADINKEQQHEQQPPKEEHPGYHYTPAKPPKPISDGTEQPMTDAEIDELADLFDGD